MTATEIRIGSTNSLSGPLSSYSVISRCTAAMFKRQNDEGGIAGRKISFTVYDDGFQPPKTLEQARRLIEQDKVAFLFNTLGTATNSAIQRYVNARKVPHLFLATGADKWANPQEFPWTIGWQPSYRVEAQIYAKHILEQKPDAKVALLYQNDDFGKDFINGLKDVLGARYDAMVRGASYEATDPTIDSQVVSLQQTGAEVAVLATAPKFAAMAIRKIHDLGWRPLSFVANIASSAGAVMNTAGAGEGHRRRHLGFPQGPHRSGLGERSRHERVARLHAAIRPGRRPGGQQLHARLRLRPDHAADAEAVRQRLLARERHAAGDEPHAVRGADAAAGHHGQHHAAQLPPGPPDAAAALGRQILAALRPGDRGRRCISR